MGHGPSSKPSIMSPAQKEALQTQIEQGRVARRIQSEVDELLDARFLQICREAVTAFRNTRIQLDGNTAVRYIACMSEVLALKEELERRDRKGNDATDKLMSGSTEG